MDVLLVWNGPANEEERAVLAKREVHFVKELIALGVRVSVMLCGDRGGLARDLERAKVPVFTTGTPLDPAPASALRLPHAVAALRRVIAHVKPAIIEALEPVPAIASGLAARLAGRRPLLVYRRQHQSGRRRLILASRAAAKLSDRTSVSGESMRIHAERDDRVPRATIDVSPPGTSAPRHVPASEVAALRAALGIGAGMRVIGAVSRLRFEKGLDVLIDALRSMTARDVHAVIVGSGPEESRLRELANSSPVPVHFTGHRDDVAPWIACADVIAMPSRRESFGRVTLEAMAAGKPVIASNVGGLPEAIDDGRTGLLVPPDDAHALAAALDRVLTDDVFARTLGDAAALEFASRYTIRHMAEARRGVWENALRQGKRR